MRVCSGPKAGRLAGKGRTDGRTAVDRAWVHPVNISVSAPLSREGGRRDWHQDDAPREEEEEEEETLKRLCSNNINCCNVITGPTSSGGVIESVGTGQMQ